MSNNPNKPVNLLVTASVDKTKADEGIRSLRSLKQAIEDTRQTSKDFNSAQSRLSDGAIEAVNDLRKAYSDLGDEVERTQKKSEKGFNVSGLRRTGGALTRLGLQSEGAAIGDLGAVGQIGRQVGELENVFKSLSPAIADASKQGASLLGAISPAAAGIGSLVGVLAPLALAGVAVGVIAGGLAALDHELDASKKSLEEASTSVTAYYKAVSSGTEQSIEDQRKALEKKIALEQAELDTRSNAEQKAFDAAQKAYGDAGARLLVSIGQGRGAFKPNDDEIEKLKKSITDDSAQLGGLGRALDDTTVKQRTYEDALIKQADEGIDRAKREAEALKATSAATKEKIEVNRSEITAVRGARDQVIDEIQRLVQAGGSQEAIDQLTKKTEEYNKTLIGLGETDVNLRLVTLPLIEAREAETKAIEAQKKAFQDAAKDAGEINKRATEIDKLKQDRTRKLEDEAASDSQRLQQDILKKRIDAAKEKEALEGNDDKAIRIKQQAGDQLQRLNEQLSQADQKAAEQYNRQVGKINETFQRSEIKAVENYHRQEAQAQDRFNKDRLRAAEDLRDKLQDDADNGDVVAFLRDQKAGEKELRRKDEDESGAAQQRDAAFADQRAAARDQYQQQLSDAQQAYALQNEERQRSAAEQRKQIAEQEKQQLQDNVAEIKKAGKQKNTESMQLEKELASLQEKFRIENENKRKAREQADYDERLKTLQTAQDATLAELGKFKDAMVTKFTDGIKQIQGISLLGGIFGGLGQNQQSGGSTGINNPNSPGGFNSGTGPTKGGAKNLDPGLIGALQSGKSKGGKKGGLAGDIISAGKVKRHADGFEFVPEDFYPAFLDYGERVQTKREADQFRGGRGAGGSGMSINAPITVHGATPENAQTIGKEIVRELTAMIQSVTGI